MTMNLVGLLLHQQTDYDFFVRDWPHRCRHRTLSNQGCYVQGVPPIPKGHPLPHLANEPLASCNHYFH